LMMSCTKKKYPQYSNTSILIRGAKIDNTFILKLIIQGLLWLYKKNLSSNLIKTKTLFMTSTNKITLNVSQTKHSTLNIIVQQTL
jgi:hypothetical protein